MKLNPFKKNPGSSRLNILEVIRIMPSGRHAMVRTSKGEFKKELKNIPADLLQAFWKENEDLAKKVIGRMR